MLEKDQTKHDLSNAIETLEQRKYELILYNPSLMGRITILQLATLTSLIKFVRATI